MNAAVVEMSRANMSTYRITRNIGNYCLEYGSAERILENVWQKFVDNNSVDLLLVDHVLPYLSSMEADLAMLTWFDALSVGGKIRLTVPNTDHFMAMWQAAVWNNARLCDAESDARVAFSGLWGPQENSNPRCETYDECLQRTYRSGYNRERVVLLLERAGFTEIDVVSCGSEVKASALKTMDRGERQMASRYDQIRSDHLNRYSFACEQIGTLGGDSKILDLACGVGYGTLMLADRTGASVTGIDVERSAIAQARKHFCSDKTKYLCQDARLLSSDSDKSDFCYFDAVVSFETVEHVDFARQLIDMFFRALKPGGLLFCSTPNQDVMPFDREVFSYHVRHFTNPELVRLLSDSGFTDVRLFAQHDRVAGEVVEGVGGCFTIAVAVKPWER